MDIKKIKVDALKNLKRNYFKIILTVFIIGIILNFGYRFTTVMSGVSSINGTKTNYEIMNDLVNTLSNRISTGGYNNGVIGSLFNSVTQSNSIVIGFLNAINIYLFNKKIDIIYVSLVGVLIIILLKIFIQDVFRIGYKRFFLEERRYNISVKKILFPFKVRKNIHIGFVIFKKNIYQFLWSLTFVFGFIKHYEYSMIPYILAENPNIKTKDVFKLSKQISNGYKFKMFKIDLSFMGWNLLNILTLGFLDIFFLLAYKECVYAEVYMKLRINNNLLNDKYLDIEDIQNTEYPMDKYSIPTHEIHLLTKDYKVKYSIKNYILMFFTFSVIGWLWEVLFHIINEGRFVNRGVMLGPWLPIYGFGGLFILIILKPLRHKPVLFFISAMILAGIMEYTTGWYLETFMGSKWWDYTGYFLNIHGRVCLEGLLVFGFGGAAVTYFLGPILNQLYDKIKPKISIIICIILVLLYSIDFVYSYFNPNKGEGITEYEVKVTVN